MPRIPKQLIFILLSLIFICGLSLFYNGKDTSPFMRTKSLFTTGTPPVEQPLLPGGVISEAPNPQSSPIPSKELKAPALHRIPDDLEGDLSDVGEIESIESSQTPSPAPTQPTLVKETSFEDPSLSALRELSDNSQEVQLNSGDDGTEGKKKIFISKPRTNRVTILIPLKA